MSERRKSPARGRATNNAGERPTEDTKSGQPALHVPRKEPRNALAWRLRIGDTVGLRHLPGHFEVVAMDDPSLLTLRTASGARLKAGWRTVIRSDDPSQGGRP